MKKLSRTKIRKEWIWAYVFIAPMFIGTLIFGLFPIVYSFVLSVTDWNLLSGFGGFVGLKNFATVFTSKRLLRKYGILWSMREYLCRLHCFFPCFLPAFSARNSKEKDSSVLYTFFLISSCQQQLLWYGDGC